MAFSVTRETVVSYTAFPPLPGIAWRYLSVALSLESPPPDVIRHPALWSPDFPHLALFSPASRDYMFYFAVLLYHKGAGMSTRFCVRFLPAFYLNIKAAAADEFPQNGILGHRFTWDSHKVVQEFQQALCFLKFRRVLRNPEKDRFRVLLQYG